MSYRWRALTTADTPQWSELCTRLAEADDTGEVYSAEDLAEELEFPGVDSERDTIAVVDESDALVAFGQVYFRDALVDGAAAANCSAGVDPDHRGRGLGTELTRRLEARARAGSAERHPGVDLVLRVDCGAQAADARQLFDELGYVESRFFFEMTHALSGVDGAAALPPGIRPYEVGTDDAPVHDAHTEAFATHWRSAPWSDDEWQSRVLSARAFRPEHSFVRPGRDGEIEGYVVSFEYEPEELYVMLLGVREAGRGRGTGTTLLRTALAAAKAAGYERAGLGVDSANSTGAGRLYEALGFRTARTLVAALKTLTTAS